MRRFIMYVISLVAILYFNDLYAIPAYPGIIDITQPTGDPIQLYQVGDEYGHILRTIDGHAVMEDDGAYYYADLVNGNLICTDILVHDPGQRPADETEFLDNIDDDEVIATLSKWSRTSVAQAGLGLTGSYTMPTTGSPKAIVILVEFTDLKFTDKVDRFQTTTPHDYFDAMLNSPGFSLDSAHGSVLDYFSSVSNGAFTPQFDVFGPYTLSHNKSYYGADAASGSHDANKLQLINDACSAADNDIDFNDYAYDGSVPFVFIFYAGVGQNTSASSNDIWPSANDFGGTFDGVAIDRYACGNAVNVINKPIGIGTFVHEFSHILGLPDLYSGTVSVTPGYWSVMDYGMYLNDGRCPAGYGAYERNALQWTEPTILTSGQVSLQNIAENNECCLIQTPNANEYFLLENRQKVAWDKYLPGHGLLVWHIDYDSDAFANSPNKDAAHQRVDIIEANCTPNNGSTSTQAGYTFPGTSGKTALTPYTTPALLAWDESDVNDDDVNTSLSDITEQNGVITFLATCGYPFVNREVIANEAEDVTTTSFTASWQPVTEATAYFLTVKEGDETNNITEKADFGDLATSLTLPSGWSASIANEDIFSDAEYDDTYYGTASPAAKLSGTSAYIISKTYDDPVTKFQFWYRGIATTDSHLSIMAHANNAWSKVTNIPLDNEESATVTFTAEDLPEGTSQVRIDFYDADNGGSCAIDDIIIESGVAATVVGDYNSKNVGDTTAITLSDLDLGEHYSYSVYATNGTSFTQPSDQIEVDLKTEEENDSQESNTNLPQYSIPEGTTSDGVYLQKIETRGTAAGDHTVYWNTNPSSLYTLLEANTGVKPGSSFSIDIDYNFAPDDASDVENYCDCSYVCIFTDWDRDGKFSLDKRFGMLNSTDITDAESNKEMLTDMKTITFTVPDDVPEGWSCIRIMLNRGYNAVPLNTAQQDGAIATNLVYGRVYDLPIAVYSIITGVGENSYDASDDSPIYYTISGIRVSTDNLPSGVYLVKRGTTVQKILIP